MLSALVATSLATVSCSSDDDSNVIDQPSEINVPSTYSFSRGGESTVSFSGQTTRILMSEEIVSSFSDFDATPTQDLFSDPEHHSNAIENHITPKPSNVKSKAIAKIIVLYTDGSFEAFEN